MDNNKSYFYISGFLSITLFIVIFVLFVNTILSNEKKKTYGLKKDKFITVSIVLPQKKILKKKVEDKKEAIKERKRDKIITKTDSDAKNVNVNDLFSDVWTREYKKPKKVLHKIDIKRIEEISKTIKITKKKTINSVTQKIKNIDELNVTTKDKKVISADEVNEYLVKIKKLVYDNFFTTPNMLGFRVKAVIELSSVGKVMDFRILQLSSNEALNNEVLKIKDRIDGILFPINPNHKPFRVIVNLIPEEKEKH